MYKNGKPNYNERVFTQEQLEDIKELYLSGISSVKIGKIYGTDHKPILRVLHRMNVDVDQKKMVRKYSLDEHYFDNIDNQDKAYIFGFLLADGHNELKKSTIQMSLQEEDKYILEFMRKKLNSEKPLEFIDYSNKHDFGYTYKNQYRLEFFSKYLCQKLKEHGMIESKSKNLVFPSCISDELLSHFVRGYFDGNGSISKNRFSITSTNLFCKTLKAKMDTVLGLQYGMIREAQNRNGITSDLIYSRQREIAKILDWMYAGAEVFLERKYKKYLIMALPIKN